MRIVATIAVLAVGLSLGASGAAGAAPDDLSADPLDRAALLALPSVYRIDVTIRVEALRGRDGRRIPLPPAARTVREAGTAFGVARDGWLATARHVAAPEPATIAKLAYQEKLIAQDRPHDDAVVEALMERIGAVPVGHRVVGRVVRPAGVGGVGSERRYPVLELVEGDTADVALVRINAPTAPTLALDEAATLGTPVTTIGFGSGSAFGGGGRGELEPAIRRGALGRTGNLQEGAASRDAILVGVPVEGGDSGAPVVDALGRVRGLIVLRFTDGGVRSGIAERATEVRQLLDRERLVGGPDPTAETFRAAMVAFWGLDMRTARAGFGATISRFSDHALAARELGRATALEEADFRLEGRPRRRGALLALGVLAAAVAAGFAIALVRSSSGRDRGPHPTAGRGAPEG